MPRLLVVNPNTSQAMTAIIRVSAECAARSLGAEVDTVCASSGPQSIEGRFDEIVSAYWTLDTVMRLAASYDGIVVACFSQHVVIEGIREATEIPTVGILEASVLCALPLGARFSVVTTSPRWEPLLADGLRSLGLHERCASVRSSGLAVLDLDRLPHQAVLERLAQQAELAIAHDGAEVIVLGCAGMAGLQDAVAQRVHVPVIDAVAAGVSLVAALANAGARTSKRNLYRPVLPRPGADLPAGLAQVYGSGPTSDT
ncbi:MAG TPA: aspartate/glutamate racemase family protein [Chloroflexota bacterium]|jgi:allantoin racemase